MKKIIIYSISKGGKVTRGGKNVSLPPLLTSILFIAVAKIKPNKHEPKYTLRYYN